MEWIRIVGVADMSYLAAMKTISVKVPESIADWLTGEAERTRRSRSEIVREALEDRRNGKTDGGKGTPKPLTMAEAMADLKGTICGPRDLSTNPKHFEEFGR